MSLVAVDVTCCTTLEGVLIPYPRRTLALDVFKVCHEHIVASGALWASLFF